MASGFCDEYGGRGRVAGASRGGTTGERDGWWSSSQQRLVGGHQTNNGNTWWTLISGRGGSHAVPSEGLELGYIRRGRGNGERGEWHLGDCITKHSLFNTCHSLRTLDTNQFRRASLPRPRPSQIKSITSVAERPRRRLARPSNASRVTHSAFAAPRRWCSSRDSRSLSEGKGASTCPGGCLEACNTFTGFCFGYIILFRERYVGSLLCCLKRFGHTHTHIERERERERVRRTE